mgnify:FL=1
MLGWFERERESALGACSDTLRALKDVGVRVVLLRQQWRVLGHHALGERVVLVLSRQGQQAGVARIDRVLPALEPRQLWVGNVLRVGVELVGQPRQPVNVLLRWLAASVSRHEVDVRQLAAARHRRACRVLRPVRRLGAEVMANVPGLGARLLAAQRHAYVRRERRSSVRHDGSHNNRGQ